MNADQLKANFKQQFNDSIDGYKETDPKCAHAAGMLLILSALKRYDGPTLATQVTVMHKALTEVGTERGWLVDKSPLKPAGGDPPDHGTEPEPGQPSEPPAV